MKKVYFAVRHFIKKSLGMCTSKNCRKKHLYHLDMKIGADTIKASLCQEHLDDFMVITNQHSPEKSKKGMERLTKEHWRNLDPWECCVQDNYCKRGCHDEGGCNNGCIVPQNYRRLASYEDTRHTPEQIQAMQQEIDRLRKDNIHWCNAHDKTVDKLTLMTAERNQWKWATQITEKYLDEVKLQNAALTADKDEQAGKLMRYDTVLRDARIALYNNTPYPQGTAEYKRCFKTINDIDALLGGTE